MKPSDKIYVAGHRGMVGSAIVRCLRQAGYEHIITRTHAELDLTRQAEVEAFYTAEKPDVAIIAAARVGGIHANSTYPAQFIYDNLAIAQNTIDGAYRAGVARVFFLGSSCIYPKHAPQPMPESCLLTSELEPTNEAYAIAKIAGLKLCQHYRTQYGVCYHSAMPTNLYGPGDNYHPENSHVLPALIRRFHEAKAQQLPSVTIWGTGTPRREFLHVDDLASACLVLLQAENPPHWANVGTGEDLQIRELAALVADVVGYTGEILTDPSKPDGTPQKLLDVSLLKSLGWKPQLDLREGILNAYNDFKQSEYRH
ncbi:MAG: GDP-L-fucose synthase [Opitutales bacterium]|nr:GDP-L-fucose synthase [Opitutales bacterium]